MKNQFILFLLTFGAMLFAAGYQNHCGCGQPLGGNCPGIPLVCAGYGIDCFSADLNNDLPQKNGVREHGSCGMSWPV